MHCKRSDRLKVLRASVVAIFVLNLCKREKLHCLPGTERHSAGATNVYFAEEVESSGNAQFIACHLANFVANVGNMNWLMFWRSNPVELTALPIL